MAKTPTPASPAEKPEDRLRVNMTIKPVTLRYLNQLIKLGVFGDDKTSVSFRLVEEAIRQALADGIIQPDTGGD